MSVLDCLTRLVKAGKISQRVADDAKAIHDGMLNGDLLRDMDAATADAYAAIKTAEIMEKDAAAKKMELARATAAYNRLSDRIKDHPNSALSGFMAVYVSDNRGAGKGLSGAPLDRTNVESVTLDYASRLKTMAHDLIDKYEPKAAGLRQDTRGIRNMIMENFGVQTGDAIAAAAANGWKKAMEWGEGQAKRLGKAFGEAENWRQPQRWDTGRVNKAGEAQFKADVMEHIKAGGLSLLDKDTGAIVKSPEDIAHVLARATDDIRMDQGRTGGRQSIFNDTQRTFVFSESKKGADAYLSLMDKYGYGEGGYFNALNDHINNMSRELALMEVAGPRWRSTMTVLFKEATELDARRSLEPSNKSLWDRAGDALLRGVGLEGRIAAERLHQHMTGQLSGAGSEVVAGIMQGARSFLTSTSMGSAIVTAVPADSVNWLMAANFRGLNTGRLVGDVVSSFLTNDEAGRAFALKLGINAHEASRVAIATRQYGDSILGNKLPQRMADTVIRAQGLHKWDMAIAQSFTKEFMQSLGERKHLSFDQVDKEFKQFFTDYGFTAEDWAKIQKGQTIGVGPVQGLVLDSLEHDIRVKLASAVYDERQFAYLAGGTERVRAIATGGAKGGTGAGEAARSFFLFKQFPMTILSTWGVRAAQEARAGNWSTTIQLGLFLTMAGALALQARQVIQGKDPKDMKDGFFWAEAAFQGGAMGIYGDFLKEATSRSGTSLTETALGPLASIPAAAQRLTSGARRAAESGEHVNFGAALADDIVKFTPGGSLWFARLPFNRMIGDEIRRQLDPDYPKAFARAQKRALKDHNQEYFWAPGDSGPSRGPNMGAMFQ